MSQTISSRAQRDGYGLEWRVMANVSARRLRRDSTDGERRLWAALRDRRLAGYRFCRQHPIGSFIVDFACTKYRLVIEADGGQHADDPSDDRRSAFLQSRGWRVLRFWNNDILLNTEGAIETILRALREQEALIRSRAALATTLSRSAGEGYHRRAGKC